MRWSSIRNLWTRWTGTSARGDRSASADGRIVPSDRLAVWEDRLVDHGVSAEWAGRLAARLAPLEGELGGRAADAMLLGASLAVEVQAEVQADIERNLRDVREVERLLGAFSGELQKLGEVLEVLSAYAQRMRAQPGKPDRRTLH